VPKPPERILLSRTDSIGDVMLTLPLTGLLKQRYPGVRITFLGRRYTAPVLRCCRHVDEVITLEELQEAGPAAAVQRLRALRADAVVHVFPQRAVANWCKSAGIPLRIGTSHRWWHWITCNARVAFSRRRSDLHEAQLNVKLLEPLGITDVPTPSALAQLTGFEAPMPDGTVRALLKPDRLHIVLHPGSRGSAVEWGLDRFAALIGLLDPARHQVLLTGTTTEAEGYRTELPLQHPCVTDTGGQLSLDQLIQLVGASDALVAASTGPLHIAAASGKRAIGLFAAMRPIHPGRWAPIGRDAHAITAPDVDPESDPQQQVRAITPEQVLGLLQSLR
jgi:ADP-heptose:LPS heptosyltransferase